MQVKAYPFKIVGLPFENRLRYVQAHVKPGDEIELIPEPDNPVDAGAIAAYHRGHKVGYVPHDAYWMHDGINEGAHFSVSASHVTVGRNGGQTLLAFAVPSHSVAAYQSARQLAIQAYGRDNKRGVLSVPLKILKASFMILAVVFRLFLRKRRR